MDALFNSIMSSPLATAMVALLCFFLIFIGKVYVYPELQKKDELEEELKELKVKYDAILLSKSETLDKVAEFIDVGFKEYLDTLVENLPDADHSDAIKSLETMMQEQMQLLLATLNDLDNIKGNVDCTDMSKQLHDIAKDCTDIIRRHDVMMGALLQRLTGETHSIKLQGLQQ